MLQASCPSCQSVREYDGSLAGHQVQCPRCHAHFVIAVVAPPVRPQARFSPAPPQFADLQLNVGPPQQPDHTTILDLRNGPKSAGVAVLLSLIWPGVGQIYNGHLLKGLAIMIGFLVSWPLCLLIAGIVPVLIIWMMGLYDAYKSAERINAMAKQQRLPVLRR